MYGPETEEARLLHKTKYLDDAESFDDYCVRYSRATNDGTDRHFRELLDALRHQRLLPGGRQQRAIGQPYECTGINCFISRTIEDSMDGIMQALWDAATTMRTGGGIGFDFSTLRPAGTPVRGLGAGAYSSGPISFMGMWNAMCETIMSGGSRRGAMMGIMRIDHPDILSFIHCKRNQGQLTNFNISVAVTEPFMEALYAGKTYQLHFKGEKYRELDASEVWAIMMENTWDWAEPGVIFMDRVNQWDNLWYLAERIAATNPCGEKPMAPFDSCLLGSLNLVKYLTGSTGSFGFDWGLFINDIHNAIRAFDKVIDCTYYPLPQQKESGINKRRVGLGITGEANCIELIGHRYGTPAYLAFKDLILSTLRDESYRASIQLAKEKGAFPLFDRDKYLQGRFIQTLPDDIQHDISVHGIRNSELNSIAPTGTISMCADNVSSGIEPAFELESERTIKMPEGDISIEQRDWAYFKHGFLSTTHSQVSVDKHIEVLCRTQKYIDSAVSKTCNVKGEVGGKKIDGDEISFKEFKDIYLKAYSGGAKGCTTFNVNGKRFGLIKKKEETSGSACQFDPATGIRTCDE